MKEIAAPPKNGHPAARDAVSRERIGAKAWHDALSRPGFRIKLIVVALFLAAVLTAFAAFLGFNEARPGASLSDPFLQLYHARDFTWATFGVIYTALAFAIVSLARRPWHLLVALGSYALMASVRMVMMYSTPLAPPAGIIPLADPFIEYFGTGHTILRDLFFSGHTATLFLLVLTSPTRALRTFYLVCTVLVAAFVLAQHVHYTIDVLVAPFVSFTCYVAMRKVLLAGEGRG